MRGFSLRELLCLTALVAVLVSSVPAESLVGVVAAICLWAIAGAWRGLKCEHPMAGGALGAATAVVGLILIDWVDYVGTYFLSGRPEYYFEEDGVIAEVIVFPVFLVIFHGAFASAVGALIGFIVWAIDDYLGPAIRHRVSGERARRG